MLLVLLAVADRGAALVAGRAIAGEVQRSGGLNEEPDVEVTGFPFLSQVLSGRYRGVSVSARDVPAGEAGGQSVTLDRLDATLHGVRVPLSDVLSGDVASVPVERLDARVLLPYDELARRAGDREVTVSPAGDRLRVRGSVRVLGRELEAAAVSRVTVREGALVVRAESFEVGNGVADRLLTRVARDRFDFRVPLGGLPFGLQVRDVTVREDGLLVEADARDTVLTAPG